MWSSNSAAIISFCYLQDQYFLSSSCRSEPSDWATVPRSTRYRWRCWGFWWRRSRETRTVRTFDRLYWRRNQEKYFPPDTTWRSWFVRVDSTSSSHREIIRLRCLDILKWQVAQRRIRDLFGTDADHQSESSTSNCSSWRFSSCGWLSTGPGVWHCGVHRKKFILHSRVFCKTQYCSLL